MRIDARFVILWNFEFFKKGRGSSNFRKIRAIDLKLHTNILHPSRNFGILIVSQIYHHYVQHRPHVGMFWTEYRIGVVCFSLINKYATSCLK